MNTGEDAPTYTKSALYANDLRFACIDTRSGIMA